ncbi:MAG TPA: TlpA disulfide reductase family protein [Polyangia bacterium]|nr:TlpA disulfide reductase family protein [Polyangia bacterium]
MKSHMRGRGGALVVGAGVLASAVLASSVLAGVGPVRTRDAAVKPTPVVRMDKAATDVTILDGKAIVQEMRKSRGRGLFVHLWASWCGPCLEELPLVDVFARVVRERGGTFLSVSLDDVRRGAHVAEVLKRHAPTLTPYVARFDDPDQFMSLFSPTWQGAIPALFGFGADGRLRGSLVGEVDPDDLDELLAEIAPKGKTGARGPANDAD